ncbi:MAG: DUF4832 domain-containing protein [Lachnospiraceae bacterium]|nr:DUF4832 domain-containing protein [Lachnospiraceae bacterium]
MIKLLQTLNRYRAFKRAEFSEAVDNTVNPCRGWFQLITACIDEEPDFSEKKYILERDISLVLVLADIGAYRDIRLDVLAFSHLEMIINYLRSKGKDIILRVAYDHDGNGMEREPSFFGMVKDHAAQVAEFVSNHYKDIFIYQGLLVGKWGEMHTTRYAAEDRLRELGYIFKEEIKDRVFMAVRKPVQWRYLRIQPDEGKPLIVDGLGIYNDGMFGSDTDLGTFDISGNNRHGWGKPWGREQETDFIKQISEAAPCGGEALFGEGFAARHSADEYISELRRQGITYLNRYHDIKLIKFWGKEIHKGRDLWNGKSVLDYIGAHLGYRFIVKDVSAYKCESGCRLEVTIANTGFADMYNRTKLYIEYEGKNGKETGVFEEELQMCRKSSSKTFMMEISPLPGKIYLFAEQVESKARVGFANTGVTEDGMCCLGEIK